MPQRRLIPLTRARLPQRGIQLQNRPARIPYFNARYQNQRRRSLMVRQSIPLRSPMIAQRPKYIGQRQLLNGNNQRVQNFQAQRNFNPPVAKPSQPSPFNLVTGFVGSMFSTNTNIPRQKARPPPKIFTTRRSLMAMGNVFFRRK
ncbi:MAG: hypothetical protein AABW59_02485 [archaeon]